MQPNTPEWRGLMNEVAYSLIREQAPGELALYTKTRDRYFADPAGFTVLATTADRPLGMGGVEALQNFSQTVFPLLTPILAAIATAVAAALQQRGLRPYRRRSQQALRQTSANLHPEAARSHLRRDQSGCQGQAEAVQP